MNDNPQPNAASDTLTTADSGGLGVRPLEGAGGSAHVHRGHLRHLAGLARRGELTHEDVQANLAYARRVRDSDEASVRDRNAAVKLINELMKITLDAAVQADRIERLDAGQATDRTEYVLSMPEAR